MEIKNDYKAYFKGKKITILGLGLIGKGFLDPIFLAKCGAEIVATDLKTAKELKPTIDKLKKYKNIKLVLGKHRFEDFENKDFILKSQGVPLDSPFILHAKKNNVPVEMDESLFMKLAKGVTIIGVTGTRGKTTTTVLIYEILKKAYDKKTVNVFVAGNLPGTAALPLLSKVKPGDIVVLELSSWQLQGFGDSKISPHIAVFTNFMSDHLNYYNNDLKKYFDDKAEIFLNQKQNDYLVTTPMMAHIITAKHYGKLFNDPIICKEEDIPKDWKMRIPGKHNRENAALAIKVAKIVGVKDEITKSVLEKFRGVEGRLEFLKKYNGVSIWNDNNSTTPEATVAALKAVNSGEWIVDSENKKNIILIMGGADKNIDMSKLLEEIPKHCKAVILLTGSGSEKFKALSVKPQAFCEAKNLKNAVTQALKFATKGDILLFSPAFASFGLFKNEYERNDQFVKIIKSLN